MYFEEKNIKKENIRTKVIKALVFDTKTRYAGEAKPQKECRFNIPCKCYKILNPKFGDNFYVSKQKNSNTSIIITKNQPKEDLEFISKIRFGTGKKYKKNRLRINQNLAKIFGACDIGISVFNYNNSITDDILKEYNNYYIKNKNGYWKGKICYNSRNIWKIESDKKEISIVKMGIKKSFTEAEKDWLLTLRKDFKKIISTKENILTSHIRNLKI